MTGQGRGPLKLTTGRPAGASSPCKGEDGRGSTASRFSRTPEITARARKLRGDPTDAEQKLWWVLRCRQIDGLKFRRQHPSGPYVLDFYCSAIRLAIEVDGGQHNDQVERLRDERRTGWLASRGVTVLRFWNNDVLGNPEGVWSEIVRAIEMLDSRRAPPSLTLPLSGGGKEKGEQT
jgi:very-short-patch-repair endonuclease